MAGRLPVRLAGASSLNVTSRTWWCADGPALATKRPRSCALACALVRLVTAQVVSREVLPVAVSLRHRVILMVWRACGKSRRLTWASFRGRVSMRPCPASRAVLPAGCLPPGHRFDPGVQQRLVLLHDGDVVGFLIFCQPVQVRPGPYAGVEGHHRSVQVHRFQQLGEVAGFVVLDVHLNMIQEMTAVLGDAEEMDPGAVGAAGPAAGLAVHGHCP